MTEVAEQAILDFYTYPPIGGDDWRYTFQTAQVRVLEMQMLTPAALLDIPLATFAVAPGGVFLLWPRWVDLPVGPGRLLLGVA